MPDPKALRIGDLVRFVSFADEWSKPGCFVPASCRAFQKALIRRRRPSRISWIDEWDTPWIEVRLRVRGRIHIHTWGILESTGWRLVKRRGGFRRRDTSGKPP
jgi:hypothetical protein